MPRRSLHSHRHPPGRAALSVAGIAIAIVLIALALHVLAMRLTTAHLDADASRRMSLFQHGRSPWQWRLRGRTDLVAQRVFGPATLASADGGLSLTSRGKGTFEIGLPLRSPADLSRASVLHVRLRAAVPFQMFIITRAHPGAEACMARLPDPAHRHAWSLKNLIWHGPCTAPHTVSMLRLRFRQAAGASVLLQRVAMRLPDTAARPEPSNAVQMHGPAATTAHRLQHLLQRQRAGTWPMLVLPPTHAPQQLLDWHDLALRRSPAAIVWPHGANAPSPALAPPMQPAGPFWPGIALYLILLGILLAWRARTPLQLWLDMAAALAGPLWVILGMHLASPLDWRQALPLAAGLGYAVLRALSTREPSEWRWFGQWRAYPPPLALVGAAFILAMLFGHAWHPPTAGQALVYLAWALLQQWLMLAFILRRLERTLPARGAAIIVCATLFALLHTPNARLMLLCFGAELYWAWCFTRRRALVPIALAHACGALVLQAALSGGWLRSLEISARYFLP